MSTEADGHEVVSIKPTGSRKAVNITATGDSAIVREGLS